MLGKQFIAASIAEGSTSALLKEGDIGKLFNPEELKIWNFVKAFVVAYGKLPSVETVEANTKQDLPTAVEPPAYYLDILRHDWLLAEMKSVGTALNATLKDFENGGPYAALENLRASVLNLSLQTNAADIIDLRDAGDPVWAEHQAQLHKTAGGLKVGFPTLDKMTMGLKPGDVLSLVGETGLGKTQFMAYMAHHGWAAAEKDPNSPGESRLFISLEVKNLQLLQRMLGMHTHLPMTQIKEGTLGKKNGEYLRAEAAKLKKYKKPFWVVDANLSVTVNDILELVMELKPDAVFLDGAYLIRHPTEEDRYRRVAENMDLIKMKIAARAPTVCSWQTKEITGKAKKAEQMRSLDNIADSKVIARDSSIVIGLFEEESAETLKGRTIEVLKGRGGEAGVFAVEWDWRTMRFGERENVVLEELQLG